MGPSIAVRNHLTEYRLDVICHDEDGIYVAYIPALDLSTHGDSEKDALKAAGEAAGVFLEEIIRMGTVDQVLTELGWKKSSHADNFSYLPPRMTNHKIPVPCHA